MFASAIVVGLFILKGGSLVDRGDAKKIMIITQLCMGLLVLCLAFVCEWGDIKLWHFIVFAAIEGLIISYDSPTFLAVVSRLVEKKDFQQAITLNSLNFHIGRMIGPLVAGAMLTVYGASAVFYLDALGFFIVSFMLYYLKIHPQQQRVLQDKSGLKDLSYFYKDKKLRYMLGQMVIAMITTFPMFITVLKTLPVSKFAASSAEFGQLFMYPALGSVFGSLAFAVWKPEKPIYAIRLGIPFLFLSYVLLPSAQSLTQLGLIMSFMGFFAYLMIAAITVGLQLDVLEEYRGRVSSLVGFAFGCIGPFASLPVGVFARHFGEEFSIYVFALAFIVLSSLWYALHNSIVFKS